MQAAMLLDLPLRGLSEHDKDQLVFAARDVCGKHPDVPHVGFHTRDKRIVRELKKRNVRTSFIKGDGCPGWWFIYARDVIARFGGR